MEKRKIILGSIGTVVLILLTSYTQVIGQQTTNEIATMEITSQICGIPGFGNTKVKLSREQYQDFEQYLVEFRIRLNQTKTREEAVPIFEEVVVELDKYGLIPKGLSNEEAKQLVTRQYEEERMSKIKMNFLENLFPVPGNVLCLIAGQSTNTYFIPLIARIGLLLIFSLGVFLDTVLRIFNPMPVLLFLLYFIIPPIFLSWVLPPTFLSWICFGESHSRPVGYIEPSYGWLSTIGLNGIKNWDGYFTGAFLTIGVIGFTGIKLYVDGKCTYFGAALGVRMET